MIAKELYSKRSLAGFPTHPYLCAHRYGASCPFWSIVMTLTPVAQAVQGANTTAPRTPTIPLKHRPNCPSAQQLFADIMGKHDFGPIIRSLLRERVVADEAEAQDLIKAFVQWYATGSVTKTKSYVMFDGQVDKVFHQMILNTPWYMEFCYATTGVYTHHEPIGQSTLTNAEVLEAAVFTLRLLEHTWGKELHPQFKALKEGELTPVSVSCVGNQASFDIVPITPQY